ncbi:MAG TPA: thioredoxin family protein [Candidatus Akkermansia intestinigallinarum]|uniref:Thioredoxin family protein n=1 Tax=Candidatus Akkermansia intestinigallinarum TaxID=2838431 RepID=A0A9D2AG75_9BACT|nr:thioredoxin family protein [Candidatus Akkermansia intestinigallinarum]
MRNRLLLCLGLSAALLLSSCSLFGGKAEEKKQDRAPVAADQLPQLGNPLLANKGDINAVNLNVATEEELRNFDNGAEGELIFSDPDDIEASEEQINALYENRRRGNGWISDYSTALRLARRTERPMLIWFHDSMASPKSNALAEAVLNTPSFDSWCDNRVIRVLLDDSETTDEFTGHKSRYSLNDLRAMGRRFGVSRRPAVVVVSMSGRVTPVIDGVDDTDWKAREAEICKALENAESDYEDYKDKLRDKGYRDWTRSNRRGTFFAKLQRVDRARGVAYLRQVGGRVLRMRLKSMTAEDAAYVESRSPSSGSKKN